MKILCGVHIPYKLVAKLSQMGIEAEHVNRILDRWNTSDNNISRYADSEDFVLLTKDVDFRNSFFIRRTPRKLIRVQLGNIPNAELINIVQENFYIEINQDGVTVISTQEEKDV